MGLRAPRMDPISPVAEETPPRPPRTLPPLVMMVLPVAVVGGLAMLHVVTLARLSQLEYERQRWEVLCQEQAAIRDDLLQARAKLIAPPALSEYVARHQLVPAPEPRPLRLGSLPQYQVYWRLPDEVTAAPAPVAAVPGASGTLVGWQAPAPDTPPVSGL